MAKKQMVAFCVDGLSLQSDEDGEPRVRDIDLAKRLGFKQPRDIRKLIKRLVEDGEIAYVITRATVARVIAKAGSTRAVEVEEAWLDQDQTLMVCVHAATPKAAEVRKLMVRVFRQFLEQQAAATRINSSILRRLYDAFLLPKATGDWEIMFKPTLVKALAALHGVQHDGGSHPRFLASTNRKIYDTIFSCEGGREFKVRNPTPHFGSNHHQLLTPEGRDYLASQLDIVEALAHQSANKDDFWRRMERHYGDAMLQLSMDN